VPVEERAGAAEALEDVGRLHRAIIFRVGAALPPRVCARERSRPTTGQAAVLRERGRSR